jgi:hypothetical protein
MITILMNDRTFRRTVLTAGATFTGAISGCSSSGDGGTAPEAERSGGPSERPQSGSAGAAEVYASPEDGGAGIQEAIDSLPTAGGTVYLQPGEYTVEQTILLRNRAVRIEGIGFPRVKASPSLRVHETDDGSTVKGIFDNVGNVSRNEEDYLDRVVLTGFEIDGNVANIDNDPESNQTGANLNYVRHCVLDALHVHHTVNHSVIAGGTEYLYVLNSRFEYAGENDQPTTDAHVSAPYGKQWYVNNYFNWATDNAIYLNHCEGATSRTITSTTSSSTPSAPT